MNVERYDVSKQLSNAQAQKLLRYILTSGGEVVFTRHALKELADDGCRESDARNVLMNGRMLPSEVGEPKADSWRYRFHTQRMCVVVEFDTVNACVVVTAWRKT